MIIHVDIGFNEVYSFPNKVFQVVVGLTVYY